MQFQKIPEHLAIIMDGNGRWAQKRLLPRTYGHREGVKRVKEIVRACGELGIKYLTLFVFSAENWKRSKEEVQEIMDMLKRLLKEEEKELIENDVKFETIGRKEGLSSQIIANIKALEEKTKHNQRMKLILAINYSGRAEIEDAIKKIIRKGYKDTEIKEDVIVENLYSSAPYPDLLIRTGGEIRISNFLLWQIAYTEFYFTPTLWPDFYKSELLKAIEEYNRRERRFGA